MIVSAFLWTIGLLVLLVLVIGIIKGVRDSRKGKR